MFGFLTAIRRGNYKHDKCWVHRKAESFGVDISSDSRFRLVDGFYDKSLTQELQTELQNVILVNMDVDLHSSGTLVLDWILPLLQEGTIIYTDDWHFPMFDIDPEEQCGVSLAFKQWLERNPSVKLETIGVMSNSQRYFKVTSA